jgi:hypothetical protein
MSDSASVLVDDRLLLPCEGGPCHYRSEHLPPRVEIDERDGIYALVDDGEPHEWRYLFVPDER